MATESMEEKKITAPNLPKSLKDLKFTDSGVSVNPKEHKYEETQRSSIVDNQL